MRISDIYLKVILALLLGCGLTITSASIIYDNTTTPLGPYAVTALKNQIGDEVNAAGTDRHVTELHVGLHGQSFESTADLQARLYANDDPDGKPGTLLWESLLFDDVALSVGDQLFRFLVPKIIVPDTFTWTIQITDPAPIVAGVPFFNPPTIGSSPDYAWFGSQGAWTQLRTTTGEPVNLLAQVRAVPEPETVWLIMAGLVIMHAWRRQIL